MFAYRTAIAMYVGVGAFLITPIAIMMYQEQRGIEDLKEFNKHTFKSSSSRRITPFSEIDTHVNFEYFGKDRDETELKG